jgi:hypothetical protein
MLYGMFSIKNIKWLLFGKILNVYEIPCDVLDTHHMSKSKSEMFQFINRYNINPYKEKKSLVPKYLNCLA